MYTVCGQPQPHQARPTSAVVQNTAAKIVSMSSIKQHAVGGQEGVPEQRKLAMNDVQQDGGLAANRQRTASRRTAPPAPRPPRAAG